MAPALLEIEELGDDRALVLWRTSVLRPAGANPRPVLPEDCTQLGDASLREVEAALETRWEIRCPGGLEHAG